MKTKTTRESVPGVDDPCLRGLGDVWNPAAWAYYRVRPDHDEGFEEMVVKARPGDCGRLMMGISEEPESNGETRAPGWVAVVLAVIMGAGIWWWILGCLNY